MTCAMAAHSTPEAFDAYIASAFPHLEAPWDDPLMIGFMASEGWMTGWTSYRFKRKVSIDRTMVMETTWKFDNHQALLSVASQTYPGCHHMVYWDGERVQDPAPDASPDGELLEAYAVVDVYPLMWGGEDFIKGLSHAALWADLPRSYDAPESCYAQKPPDGELPIWYQRLQVKWNQEATSPRD